MATTRHGQASVTDESVNASQGCEVLAALKAALPAIRGWAAVVRRSHGHHSQQSAAADAVYKRAREAATLIHRLHDAAAAEREG